jgi:hypothetical protein
MSVAAFLALVAGLAALSVTMGRHSRDWPPGVRAALPPRGWTVAGWAGLALGVALCVSARGWSQGLLLAIGLTLPAAAAVVAGLAARESKRAR